jgi:hypothetical protein
MMQGTTRTGNIIEPRYEDTSISSLRQKGGRGEWDMNRGMESNKNIERAYVSRS